MATLVVNARERMLRAFERTVPCAIGRAGACTADEKREGDKRTPIGRWPVRGVLIRRDRIVLTRTPRLPWRWLRPTDGWSDDAGDPAYNRPVRLGHPFGAEALWRDDGAYDIIVVLGYNDTPPRPGRGSAIFLHLVPESGVTAGCVAIARPDLLRLVPELGIGDVVVIRAGARMDPAAVRS